MTIISRPPTEIHLCIKINLKFNIFNWSKYDKKFELMFSLNYGFAALFVEQPPALPGPISNCTGLNHIVPKCSKHE